MAESFQCKMCYDRKSVVTRFEKIVDSYYNNTCSKVHLKKPRSDCGINHKTKANDKAKTYTKVGKN